MAFRLILTERFLNTYSECVSYVSDVLENPRTAALIEAETEKCLNFLKENADGYALFEDKEFAALGLRKIHLARYHYKIMYHLEGDEVILEAFYHDLRDAKKLLK